jgi:hypothetical protein
MPPRLSVTRTETRALATEVEFWSSVPWIVTSAPCWYVVLSVATVIVHTGSAMAAGIARPTISMRKNDA